MIALQIVRTSTKQTFTEYDRSGQIVRKEWFAISWVPLGDGKEVKDMAEAKALYGGSPVLGVGK
jgi:hypothetical protein